MNAQLREALHDLADTQAFRPDPATWDRGRRARRRDRAVLIVAVLVLVASVGGIGALGLGERVVPPADAPVDGAVPRVIHAVPERFNVLPDTGHGTAGQWDERVAVTDLAPGPASVLATSGMRPLPLLVRASDGAHLPWQLPDLPRSALAEDGGPGLALSPDGTHAAYGYARRAVGREDYSPVPSGIRVVDLRDGSLRDIDLRPSLTDGQAVLATDLVWSPDGRWLAWSGMERTQFNASGEGTASRHGPVAGVIAPGASVNTSLTPGMTHVLAVADDGRVFGIQRGRIAVWDGSFSSLGAPHQHRALDLGSHPGPSGAMAPDGRHLLVGSWTASRSVQVLDTTTGEVLRRQVPADQGRISTRALGWIDEDLMVVQVERRPGDRVEAPTVVVMSSPTVAREEWTYRIAARTQGVGMSGVGDLSVAVDLLGLGEGVPGITGVAEFPAPDWPWSTERAVVAWLLTLLAAAAATYVLLRALRGPLSRRRLG